MKLMICTNCGEHYLREQASCPHCKSNRGNTKLKVSLAVLMGVSLTGCPFMPVQSKYGMPPIDTAFIDNDGDGFVNEDDCDDTNQHEILNHL